MTNEYWNGLKAISERYGRETQRIKLIEELGELVTALAKDDSFSAIADEIADGKRFPTRKPDIDNIIKAVLDALSGKAWVDDSAVTRVLAEKHYGEPRIMVSVAWEEE